MPQADAATFGRIYAEEGAQAATSWLYGRSFADGYVMSASSTAAMRWWHESPWGPILMTVNEAKPEKDPRAIAKAAQVDGSPEGTSACVFCETDSASSRHLAVPLCIGGEKWSLHFSPYSYFDEHCIVATKAHRPMRIDERTFSDLLELCDMFPHYFFGSNADLPIVGGSILAHHHYQGGLFVSPLEKAPVTSEFELKAHPGVRAGFVRWPMTVIRLEAQDKTALVGAAASVLAAWQSLDLPELGILSHDEDGTPHSTITPIVRKLKTTYRLDLVLRNNRTSLEYPLGIFHPHEEVHAVKKENIGLIEAMGMAILPPRVGEAFDIAAEGAPDRERIGSLFVRGLEQCGVLDDPLMLKDELGLG